MKNLFFILLLSCIALADTPPIIYQFAAPLVKTGGKNVSIPKADSTHDGYLSSSDFNAFSAGGTTTWGTITGTLGSQTDLAAALSGKEPTITAGTSSQYWRGDKTFQTLNTLAVPELTNLYFTNARARLAISATSPVSYDNSTGIISFSGSFGVSNVSASSPLFSSGGATPNITIQQSDSTHNGYLSSADWSTFSSKEPAIASGTSSQYWRGDKTFQTLNTLVVPELTNLYYTQGRFDSAFAAKSTTNLTEGSNLYFTNARAQGAVSATAPLVDTAGVFSIPKATGSVNGYLDKNDWTTFNNKLDASAGNYITNPTFEANTTGWNLYNDSGNTVPASVVNQDITYTSTLSGSGGNGATITYVLCGGSYVGPAVTCPTGTSVQVCWYNGPSIAQNPTATVLKAAYDAQSCATAIATAVITGTASNRQYITGTSTLAGGGDTSPVDGTGGVTSGVTFTQNTSTPLVGTASGDLGKSAANEQGQGVSTDFSINSVDQNQKLQISFIYSGSSGMVLGSSSDAKVFVYDIGNSNLISVSPSKNISGPVSTAKTFVGTFKATSSANYRLIIHISTSSAIAWDLLIDSVTINNQVTASTPTQVPSVVITNQPINGSVTDHMAVMWRDGDTQWSPATIAGAALPIFGDDKPVLGFATNIVGATADIYVSGYMGGFSFGPFVGYNQYIDNTAGLISPLPSPFNDMYVIAGMAISSTELNINFQPHVGQISNGSGVPVKGGLLTAGSVNDGTSDVVLSPGANGTFLVANSAVTKGLNYRTIVAGDVPTLNQNTTGSAATWTTARNLAGNSVNGSANVAFANKFVVQGTTDAGLSAAQFLGALGTGIVKNTTTTGVLSIAVAGDFPTLNQNTSGSAASFTGSLVGDVTGTQGATAISAATVTGKALTGFVSGAGTVSATDTILQAFNKIVGNIAALTSSLISNSSGVTGTTVTDALNKLNTSVNEVLVNAVKNAGSVTANTAIPTWTTVNQDTNSNFNSSTGTFTASVAGDYTVTFTAALTLGVPTAQVYKNGTLFQTGVGSLTRTSVSTYIPNVAVNDTITVALDTTGTLTSTTTDNILTISKVSGASVPIVQARYHAATGTITSSLSDISWTTKDFDSASALSGATFTVPATTGAGVYHIDACVYLTATTVAANNTAQCAILQNGTIVAESSGWASSATTKPIQCCVRDTFKFANSDAVKVQASFNGTTNSISASNVFNYISIYKVSN